MAMVGHDPRAGQPVSGQRLQRRGALAVVAALVTGVLAKWTAQPAAAGVDGDLVLNTTNTATALTTLQSQPAGGAGYTLLTVDNLRIADAIEANGGPGSLGNAGRRGLTATGGDNGQGSNALPSNGGEGIRTTGGSVTGGGVGNGGAGLFATGGVGSNGGGAGVQGTGGAPGGTGVRAIGGGTAGSQGPGVNSTTNSTNSAAVIGNNAGAGNGVLGQAGAGVGVLGQSNSGVGVQGASNGNVGVLGQSSASVGVFASSTSSTGLFATSTSGTAIVASTNGGNAIQGASNGNVGVLGTSTSSIGGFFSSGTGTGLYATGPASGFAARFDGPVLVNGNFTAIGGSKSAAVPHPDGSHRRLYCVEAPESWFEDFGQDQVVNGRARVRLDADFDALVRGDHYQVFLTPEGDCNGLYVSAKNPHAFEVRELKGGTSSLAFSYRVVAKRKDITGPRLERVEIPGTPQRPAAPSAPPPVPPVPPLPSPIASSRPS